LGFPFLDWGVNMKSKGFTYIELVIILVVIGILVALYTSSTGDLSNVSVDAASRKVQSDIRYAHQLSTTSGVVHGVNFVANVGYTVYKEDLATPVKDPVTREDLIVSLEDFEGVTIATDYEVEFDSTGTPIVGGDDRVRLAATSGAIRDVYVVEKTGAVVIDLIEYGTGCNCELCVSH